MQAPSSLCHLPHQECQDLSDLSDLDNMEEAVENELQSLSNPQSGEGNGKWGDGGLWSLQHLLRSQPLGGWCGDGWSHHSQGYPLWGISWMVKSEGLLGWQVHTWTSWPPHLHLMVCYGLGNGSSTFLDCHMVSSKVGQFSNPCTCSSE